MKTDKHYVSEIDKKLKEFDETHEKTASQLAEIEKHRRIYELRDNPIPRRPEEEDLFKDY